jgi:molybdopterin molybdotransferase
LKSLLSVEEAKHLLLESFFPGKIEKLPLTQSNGRILAEDIISPIDLPLFDNSSMDGYAIRAGDVATGTADNPITLKVVADIPAGQVSPVRLKSGEAIRIMTGAPLPKGADAVVPIEDTDRFQQEEQTGRSVPDEVKVFKPIKRGDYIRPRAQDVRNGEKVLPRRMRLKPQDIGFLAMLGIHQVPVFQRPRVALISTGDELLPVEAPLRPGKIHESNAYALSALIQRDGGLSVDLGIAPDREQSVREILERAVSSHSDLLLSSAGVSVGAFDFVRKVIEKDGGLEFWRVNMRPGKPLVFGKYREVPFIGLPGNPVSAFIGYEVFVRPVIMKMTGLYDYRRPTIRVKLLEEVESDGRESYLRAMVSFKRGVWLARLTGHQGSGNLRSLVQANALLIIPSGVKSQPAGSEVDAWFLGDFNEVDFTEDD